MKPLYSFLFAGVALLFSPSSGYAQRFNVPSIPQPIRPIEPIRPIQPQPIQPEPAPPDRGDDGRGGGGNNGGGKADILPHAFVLAVCAHASDISVECVSQSNREAASTLAKLYLEAYLERVSDGMLTLYFPYAWSRT